jgi:hypothetical protein
MWTKNYMVKSWDHSCQQVYRTKKKKSLQDHTKINSYREKKQCTSPYVNMASNLTAASKYTEPKKKKSLQDHMKINSYGEKNNAQVPISIWHQISTWQGLKSKKCFMV